MSHTSILCGALTCLALACPATAQDLFDQTKIRDFYFTFKQTNWWNLVLNSRSTSQDIKADLRVDNVTYPDVGFRIKGASSSSVSSNKKPFNLTMDTFTPDQSLYGFETLNLNNGAYDPTMTRETISYEIFRDYIPTPRTTYIRVHLNNTFWGVYILIEQPNKDLLRTWFVDTDGTRYKGDRPSGAAVETSTLNILGANQYYSHYESKNPTHPNAWTDLIQMINRLNNLPAATFKQEIVKYLNVDRALWYLACNNSVVNSDDYMGAGHNYYMYFDPMNGQMNMLPWDCNEAFGVHGPSTNPWLYLVNHNATSQTRPLVRRLFAVPEWKELYFAHYRTIVNRWINWQNTLGPLNKKFQDLIRADVAREPYFLFSQSQFNPSFAGRFFFNGHYIHGLKEVIEGRETFLKSRKNISKPEPQLSDAKFSSAAVLSGQKVQTTVKVVGNPAIQNVVVRSTTMGVYVDNPMYDDGQHGDGQSGDGVYGGTFTAGNPGLPTRFYFHATDTTGTVQVLPKNAEHGFYQVPVSFPKSTSDLTINEILADNETIDQDTAGDFDDWIELHNRSNTAFDASGLYLSDKVLEPKKWRFPANTSIPARGYLRVWCDNEPNEGPLHTTFKLNKDGETLVLSDKDSNNNTLLDGLVFRRQKADRAFGSMPDGSAMKFYLWDPTPMQPTTGTGIGKMVRFDARRTGAPSGMDLLPAGSAQNGKLIAFNVVAGPANSTGLFALSLGVLNLPLAGIGNLLIDPGLAVIVPISIDANGNATVSGTVPASAVGATLYTQCATANQLSNGIAARISN